MSEKSFTVFVVDDDDSIRKALKRLLTANGYKVMTFESAEDFLLSGLVRPEGCIVLDIRLPGMSGFDLYWRRQKSEDRIQNEKQAALLSPDSSILSPTMICMKR